MVVKEGDLNTELLLDFSTKRLNHIALSHDARLKCNVRPIHAPHASYAQRFLPINIHRPHSLALTDNPGPASAQPID